MEDSGVSSQYSSRPILESIFKCRICRFPLLMFGCNNKDCENYWEKRIYLRDKMKHILDYETNEKETFIIYWDDKLDLIMHHVIPNHRHIKEG